MKRNASYILIADDDSEDLQMLVGEFQLKNPGVHIECVQDGKDALAFLVAREISDLPAMVIADYQMPELTGEELLRLIQSQRKYSLITKVILSTSRNKTDMDRCLKNGADKYVVKPSGLAELAHIVDDLIQLFQKVIIRSAIDMDAGSII